MTKNRALIGRTHWHQDNGVALPEADETNMVTAWVAVTEATVDNGCLQVLPNSHREGMSLHCPTTEQLGIPEALIPQAEAKPVPLSPGGVLFFHPMCKHASLDNCSDAFRWSFDLRYNPIGQPSGTPAFSRIRGAKSAEPGDGTGRCRRMGAAVAGCARAAGAGRWRQDAPLG